MGICTKCPEPICADSAVLCERCLVLNRDRVREWYRRNRKKR
jgi:hypothetical protein